MIDAEWNSPISVNLHVTRAECDNPAFERTWGGVKVFEFEQCGPDRDGAWVCSKQNTDELAPRSSSVFKDGARICEVPREERLS